MLVITRIIAGWMLVITLGIAGWMLVIPQVIVVLSRLWPCTWRLVFAYIAGFACPGTDIDTCQQFILGYGWIQAFETNYFKII